jgi:transcriptional regulator with XRE-family HTH domain
MTTEEQVDSAIELGRRLRGLRETAGLKQEEVARKMGLKGKGAWNLVGRLERGKVRHPTLRVLSGFLNACGASLADVADLLGIAVTREPKPEETPVQEPMLKRKPKPKTSEQKLAQFHRDAFRAMRGVMLEGVLYDFLKNSGIADEYEDQKALAEHGRAFFQLLLRGHRRAERLRARTTRAAQLSPEQLASVETVMQRTFDVMESGGDLTPKVAVDEQAVLSGKARIRPAKKAERRLAEDLQQEIDAWGNKRVGVVDTIRREYLNILLKAGMPEEQAGPYSSFVSELCGRAEETEADPAGRRQAAEQFIARARDKDKARDMVEFTFRRWDELKTCIPPKPRALLARQKRPGT